MSSMGTLAGKSYCDCPPPCINSIRKKRSVISRCCTRDWSSPSRSLPPFHVATVADASRWLLRVGPPPPPCRWKHEQADSKHRGNGKEGLGMLAKMTKRLAMTILRTSRSAGWRLDSPPGAALMIDHRKGRKREAIILWGFDVNAIPIRKYRRLARPGKGGRDRGSDRAAADVSAANFGDAAPRIESLAHAA